MNVRNKLACKIAGLNPDRLNEMIASGQYGCAPQTDGGKARIYDRDDIVCLCIFKMLMDAGMSAGRAGHYASDVKFKMGFHSTTHVSFLRTMAGAEFTVARGLEGDEEIQSSGPKHMKFVFDINALRAYVASNLKFEDENRLAGDE